jgi:hypothetical protein
MARKIGAPAQQPRLPAPGPGNRDAAIAVFRFRYAPPPVGNGQGGSNALTFNPDHLMGTEQFDDVLVYAFFAAELGYAVFSTKTIQHNPYLVFR